MPNSVMVASHSSISLEEAGALRRAVNDAAEGRHVADALRVAVGVNGGAPPQRLLYSVALDAAGQGEYRLIDELNDRVPVDVRFAAGRDDVVRIFELLRNSDVLERAQPRQFTPDSLIGFVTVRQGDSETRILFPVWDVAPGGWKDPGMVPLPAEEVALHIYPDRLPKGLVEVFEELTEVARRGREVLQS